MTGFLQNIEKITLENDSFRQVLYTGQHAQLVVMSLQPGEDIGMEIHSIVDQFLRVEAGVGKLIMNGQEHVIGDGDAFIVPAGTEHNVVNCTPSTLLHTTRTALCTSLSKMLYEIKKITCKAATYFSRKTFAIGLPLARSSMSLSR